jgi:probable addiction module antidote protein
VPKTKTIPWDTTEHLKTDEDVAATLSVIEDGDPELMVAALGDIARAKAMARRNAGEEQGPAPRRPL